MDKLANLSMILINELSEYLCRIVIPMAINI